MNSSVYDFTFSSIDGEVISLSKFQGKVLLFVNIASYCGFTPQLLELQKLHEKYYEKGLVVIGFPCNQFANQEPDSNAVIAQNCQRKFGVTFLLSEKISVNGKSAHPLFIYMKSALPGILGSKRIQWNFTKFLFDNSGQAIKRYSPSTKPQKIEATLLKFI